MQTNNALEISYVFCVIVQNSYYPKFMLIADCFFFLEVVREVTCNVVRMIWHDVGGLEQVKQNFW